MALRSGGVCWCVMGGNVGTLRSLQIHIADHCSDFILAFADVEGVREIVQDMQDTC